MNMYIIIKIVNNNNINDDNNDDDENELLMEYLLTVSQMFLAEKSMTYKELPSKCMKLVCSMT